MEIMSVEDAAKLLKLDRSQIQRLVRQGKIQGEKLGSGKTSSYMLDADSVRAYVTADRKTGPKGKREAPSPATRRRKDASAGDSNSP
jgi:excisionase family DNA binding protein